ncbi:hypothetical protein N7G274_006500 [Stereocaulon virgatum]|uniref:tRNA (adenine(58)-N(1))-methyltransferase catalytic subunit TRM61 n=1 Tax=Stereocaulon virgatum TaxID=373712 RepID=A0ABR4A6I5_9LECA
MAIPQSSRISPFLQYGPTAEADSLAILHLRRDLLIPAVLRSQDDLNEGYDEGKVTNTRFGSFPHSTLIGTPWGSQVRASAVDTGSRGRKGWEGKGKKGQKRKREGQTPEEGIAEKKAKSEDLEREANVGNAEILGQDAGVETKVAVEAASGFVHLLPATPEIWTASLPHRTQVVYTSDYSYILHRIRARPGTVLIEAGAGSGSFTHAAARAVYNGSPSAGVEESATKVLRTDGHGKVYSFEFHEQRAQKLKEELIEHGLDSIVKLTHQDVCQDGFHPGSTKTSSIAANAIFLDLPAPWLALKHLTRSDPSSPLDPTASIYLCTFSPCIEQVQRTITTLRQLGWLEIEMVEIAAKRIEVRRERVGLQEEGLRGVNDSPASVDEALTRLREVERRWRIFHKESAQDGKEAGMEGTPLSCTMQVSKPQRLENIRNALEGRKLYREGRLVHKPEPELKTHTSYLVFAILPRDWTEEDELQAHQQWPAKVELSTQNIGPTSKRQRKREAKAEAWGNKASDIAGESSKPDP